MNCLSLLNEAAALGGYTISGGTGQDVINKARGLRRINVVKADIVSRFAGKWPANYREGWLPLVPLYNTGTANFTQGSRLVTGNGTAWITSMKGSKMLGGDVAYYKIASVTDATDLQLTQPYQGTSITVQTYQIWKDEYRIYPDALSIGGFLDYNISEKMDEAWVSNMKQSYPFTTWVEEPTVYTVLGRDYLTATYSVGTLSGSINTNILTGSGTAWLSNIEPGFQITINTLVYTVRRVNSDTEIEIYQLLAGTIVASTTYSAVGKNALIVRFRNPTNQRVVSYWYYSKDVPFVNDNDEDWIAELFPRVLVNGLSYFDYIDKNDVSRAFNSQQVFENSIKDMKVAIENSYTGIRTLGIYVPPEARM